MPVVILGSLRWRDQSVINAFFRHNHKPSSLIMGAGKVRIQRYADRLSRFLWFALIFSVTTRREGLLLCRGEAGCPYVQRQCLEGKVIVRL